MLAQLIACGPSIDSGGGPPNTGGGGSGGAGISSCECLAPYGNASMGDVELKRLKSEGLSTCFHTDDPMTLDAERKCLPFTIGQHVGDGRDIEVYAFCSDLCPDYLHVGVRYSGISDTPGCCAIGGIPLRDPAWGGFEACVPAEIHPMVSWVDMCP